LSDENNDTNPQLPALGYPEADAGVQEVSRDFGAVLLTLLINWDGWVHRRVDSVRLDDPVTVTRRVSVDFTVDRTLPAPSRTGQGDPVHFVPLAVLKKQPLTKFSLRDEAGAALPVLTRKRNGAVAASVLVSLAEWGIDDEFEKKWGRELPPELEKEIWAIAREDPPEANEIVDGIASPAAAAVEDSDDPESAWRNQLAGDDTFLEWARKLADSFILTVPLINPAGCRRILKYEYEEQRRPPRVGMPRLFEWLRRFWLWAVTSADPNRAAGAHAPRTPLPLWLMRLIGWRPAAIKIETPGLAFGGSYHLEVEAPEGLQITRGRIQAGDPPDVLEQVAEHRHRVHLYPFDPPHRERATAIVNLRPRPAVLVRTAWMTSAFTTVVLALIASRWREIGREVGPALSVLLFVPAGLAAYVARAREPWVTTEVLLGIRLLAAASALWSFAAAVVLLLERTCKPVPAGVPADCGHWTATAEVLWVLVLLSVITFAITQVTYTLVLRPFEQHDAG
jgi:hypothetical protein